MSHAFARYTFFAVFLGWPAAQILAAESSLTLAGGNGAAITFTQNAGSWRWSELTTPGATDPWLVTDEGTPIATTGAPGWLTPDWHLVQQDGNRLEFQQSARGLQFRRVYSFGPAANVLRIETWVRNPGRTAVLTRAGLLDVRIAGQDFQETGPAPASFPAFGDSLFVGIEHVSGNCQAAGDSVHLWQTPSLAVARDWQLVAAVVVGWTVPSAVVLLPGESDVRDAFLQYLDSIRIKPANLELHTNTWWSLPLPFSEKDVLQDIESLRQGMAARTGMFFDSFALDLGWSNPKSVWQVDGRRFPHEFGTIRDRLAAAGGSLGLWVSPGSAYPEGLDNGWLAAAGYEMTPWNGAARLTGVACFALGGRYQRAFKENLLRLVTTYGIRHVKFDFMLHRCDVPSHGHPTGVDSAHAIDAGLADVLDALRAVNPEIVLEPLCCGTPPSPWWLTKTPYILGPNGDDVPYGRVPSLDWMEALISARDIAYRQDQERWLMPTQALESFDIVVQSPGTFENLAVMAIGRGRWFLSTYLKPELMTPENWDFLAALVRWARDNRRFLGNATMIGGRPEDRTAYGYMFRHPEKDLYCVRNPWIEERSIALPPGASITEARDVRMIYPRRETLARLRPGDPAPQIKLAPYETAILETVAARGPRPAALRIMPEAALTANASIRSDVLMPNFGEPNHHIKYSWQGSLEVPEIVDAELCILVEGDAQVAGATCKISVGGVPMETRTIGSAGQFGAARDRSPENWTWFAVPVKPGSQSFDLRLDLSEGRAAVGVFLHGFTPARPEFPPARDSAFPLFRPNLRPWSQTLLPLREVETDGL